MQNSPDDLTERRLVSPIDHVAEDANSVQPLLKSHKSQETSGPSGDGISRPDEGEKSTFFEKLPLDIRRLILIQAFGDRTMHVDGPDEQQDSPEARAAAAGGNWTSALMSWIYSSDKETKKPQWHGFVCDDTSVLASQAMRRRKQVFPVDHKRLRKASCREDYSVNGSVRDSARIGVAGWLRTCRQAYVEGIEVLYTTNRFHIIPPSRTTTTAQDPARILLRTLPSKDHVAMITSVQLVWELGRVARPPAGREDTISLSDMRFWGWRTFVSLVSSIPSTFPRLRSLILSLEGVWFPPQMAPNDLLRRFERDLLAPIDGMVEAILLGAVNDANSGGHGDGNALSTLSLSSSSHEVLVAIPIPDFTDASERSSEMDEEDYDQEEASAGHIWRSLSFQRLTAPGGTAPEAEGRGKEGGNGMGYWITSISNPKGPLLISQIMPELTQIISQRGTTVDD